MRKIIVLLLLSASIIIEAQGVLGIPFGSSYDTVKTKLEERFGSLYIVEESGKITVMKPVIGDYEFKLADFYFQRQGHSSWFNQVFIQTWFNTSETSSAKDLRDSIVDDLKNKYEVDEVIGKNGYKWYNFGVNPKNDSEYLGYIGIFKDKGGDGKERLYLTLSYGPIYYIDKSSDF